MKYRSYLPVSETGAFKIMTENAKRACNRTWDQTVITMGSYSEWFKTEIETKRKQAEAAGIDPKEDGPVKEELYWLHRWILPRPDGVSYVVMCLQNFINEPIKHTHTPRPFDGRSTRQRETIRSPSCSTRILGMRK